MIRKAYRKVALLLAAVMALLCPPAVLAEDDVPVVDRVYGDITGDGKADAADALAVLQHSVELIALEEEKADFADVNADRIIDATDALLILQKSVQLVKQFPAETAWLALEGIFNRATQEKVDDASGAIGAEVALYNADMVRVGNTLYAYFPGEGGIHLATSVDGVRFIYVDLVIAANEDFWSPGGVNNPSVFVDNGVFYVAYDAVSESGRSSICLATSSNGKDFVCEGEIFFSSGMDAEKDGISCPDIFKKGHTWYLTYAADNGEHQQICVASSPDDLYHLNRLSSKPVLTTAVQGYDSGALGRKDVVCMGGRYYMVYSTAQGGDDATASWSHSFAYSDDMIEWIPLGRTLLPGTQSGYGMDVPNFVMDGEDVWVYYREENHSRRAKLDYDAARIPAKTEPVDHTSAAVAATLDGLFTGKTTELLTDERIGAQFHMHFPDFLKMGDEIWAYYIGGNSQGKMSTRLAVSTDGVNFTDKGVVVEPTPGTWDANMTSFAGIWLDEGVYYLVYEGSAEGCNGAVGLATSTDGIHFEKQGKILDYTGVGIEAANVGTPDLYKEGDTWYLYYHCFDWETCQICVATGPDLYHLAKADNNPIIPTVPGRFDAGTTGRRDIVYSGGWYYMVYEVSTEAPYGQADWGHSFARSKDLIHWDVLGKVVYPTTGGGMGHDGPNWYVDGDDVYVYFRTGANTTSRTKLVPVAE